MRHLGFLPLLPTGNKYLQQKWDRASYAMHRRKVTSATPTISITPPRTYNHLALKMKIQKLDVEVKIQRETNKMLEKLSLINKTAGGIDHRNVYESKSLSQERRKQELLRVSKENQMIQIRLKECMPIYSAKVWHEEWLENRKLRDSIAQYSRRSPTSEERQGKSSKKSVVRKTREKTRNGTSERHPESNGNEAKEGEEKSNKQEEAVTQKPTEAETHQSTSPSEKVSSTDTSEEAGAPDNTSTNKESLSDKSEIPETPTR